jgi:hypothetical protein
LTAIKKFWLVGLAAVAILALGLSACDDDDDDDAGASDEQLAALAEDISRTSVAAAMTTYRAEGLHNLDEEATTASEIGAGWSGSVERMHAVTVGTIWPESLQPMADELASELALAEEAIAADDLEGTKEHIALGHAAWHDLEHDAYVFIAGEEGEGEGHDTEGEASPAASGESHNEEDAGDDHEESASPTP